MNQTVLKKYAELITAVGVNLQKGQNLLITTSPQQYEFALEIADTAYQMGANYVEIRSTSERLLKSRIDHTDLSQLGYHPNYDLVREYEMLANRWAIVRLDNTIEFDVLKDSENEKVEKYYTLASKFHKIWHQALMKSAIPWCVCALPSLNWAKKIAEKNQININEDQLWEEFIKILRLDKDNPAQSWKEFSDTLQKNANQLNQQEFDKIVFQGDGTDLEIGLIPKSIWEGGYSYLPDGRCFLPNIPTEELCTTPDFKKTSGVVKNTRPFELMGVFVEDLTMEFQNGKVVNYSAKKGEETMKQFFAMDEKNRYLGEVALVDCQSPIFQSNLLFNNILFDENAACHIALGDGYPTSLANYEQLTTDEMLINAGCNVAAGHIDIMIGSEQIDVKGYTKDNKCIPIIQKGMFVI
ncbi:MAG: aminopeptidase [Spirochaetes bacterium]|nr:aminopeptidase [Spirochaetota bacterium]